MIMLSGCGPCMQFAPQWTRLAQLMKKIPEVKVAKVDCTQEQNLCTRQAVRSYPSIRMYPYGSKGDRKYFVYTNFHWKKCTDTFLEGVSPTAHDRSIVVLAACVGRGRCAAVRVAA